STLSPASLLSSSFLSFHFYLRLLLSFPTRRSSDLDADHAEGRRIGLRVEVRCSTPALIENRCGPKHRRCECDKADYSQKCVSNRSEEHTSELQSRGHLVCRLLLEKKNKNK